MRKQTIIVVQKILVSLSLATVSSAILLERLEHWEYVAYAMSASFVFALATVLSFLLNHVKK